jgi:hypothetical protein
LRHLLATHQRLKAVVAVVAVRLVVLVVQVSVVLVDQTQAVRRRLQILVRAVAVVEDQVLSVVLVVVGFFT